MAEFIELSEVSNNVPAYKVLLVGNCKVGKSCIVNRYCENEFSATYIQTNGMEYKVKYVTSLQKKLKLTLWDISGKSLTQSASDLETLKKFAEVATGIFYVYDISNKQSFLDIPKWIKTLENHKDARVQQCLIGNKRDLERQREVTRKEGTELSLEGEMRFFETSAKAQHDKEIISAFQMMIHDMKLQYDKIYVDRYEKQDEPDEPILTFSQRFMKLCCCCCPRLTRDSERKNK